MTPSTTIAAHKTIGTLAATLRARVLEVIGAYGTHGCIGDQVRDLLLSEGMKDGSLNTRYSELEAEGLIFRNGEKRLASTGRMQLVMRHQRYADELPTLAAPPKKRNPFLQGLKFGARVLAEASTLEEARSRMHAELLRAAKRAV